MVAKPIVKSTAMPYRYYLNYCTFSYSMSFWTWEDWEREIDWMAMQGINLPLAAVGTEAVWQNTMRQFGFTEEEIFSFIPGPAYTAWWLMDNIEGWGGPVSQAWIDSRVALQQKILQRMRELGIQPVLPAFYGMAPNAAIEKLPDHVIFKDVQWAGLQRPAFIDPRDSLFTKMAQVFYKEQEKLYGKALFYSGDPFHEGGKKMGDLTQSAKIIQGAMQQHSPRSTWVLQGWQESPTDELLAGTDSNYTLVLDLFGENAPYYEKRKSFNNRSFIWCNVNNFGNNTYMFANFDSITKVPIKLMNHRYSRYFKGMGLLMEGNYTDPMVYDLFYDMPWADKGFDLDQWLAGYARYRYGKENRYALDAIKLLKETVYSAPYRTENIMCARPDINADRVSKWGPAVNPVYSQDSLTMALSSLLAVDDTSIIATETYRFDLACVCKQLLTGMAYNKLNLIKESYNSKNSQAFAKNSREFLDLIMFNDSLASQMQNFSFYQWQQKARNMATTPEEAKLFAWNASRLVTLWSNEAGSFWLHDYAYREWHGLLANFYYPRWEMYFQYISEKLEGKNPTEIDFYAWEDQWCHKYFDAPPTADINIQELVKRVMDKR
ncbi:MAG: alpha-N-acetylglucosaminidase [Bacteroidales bacterium]|nr:alpha-N-acetylglucosaminidase [Bacteroidales bacterium]